MWLLSPCLVMSVHKLSPSYTDLIYDKRSLRYAHILLQKHRLNIDGRAVSVDVSRSHTYAPTFHFMAAVVPMYWLELKRLHFKELTSPFSC